MTHSDWLYKPFLSHRATNSSAYGNHVLFLAPHSWCPGWTGPMLKGNVNWHIWTGKCAPALVTGVPSAIPSLVTRLWNTCHHLPVTGEGAGKEVWKGFQTNCSPPQQDSTPFHCLLCSSLWQITPRETRAHPAKPSTSKALESGHVGAMRGTSSRHLWVRWTRCLISGAVVKEQQPSKSLFHPAGILRAALYPSQTVRSFIIQAQRTAWLALAAKLNPVPLFVTGHDYDISVSLTIEETMLTRINPGMLFTNDCTAADPHIK